MSSAAPVVWARTVAEVQRTLAAASRSGTPVVTRGAGTGLVGGADAGPGTIVLDLSRMNRVLGIDPVDGVARVEPGVVTAALDRAAAAHGLMYAPDPGSVTTCTIGGNVATNAGGLRGAKYGVTRDSLLALDVVLADGTLLHAGHDTVKGVVGLDLVGLIAGSEGTLGVVVGATVRLLPRPLRTATAVAYFATAVEAAAASAALATAGVRPAVLEFLDGKTLRAIDGLRGTGHADRGDALLLVQTDGFGAEEELEVAAAVLARSAQEVTTATDPAAAAELFAARRDALPAIEAKGPVLIEDIAVPRSRLAEAVAGVAAIAAATGADVYVFAHAGDGNLHPIIRSGPGDATRAAEEIFALALKLGGTVSAEHGVGLVKRPWLERELGPGALDLQRRIKRLFDPAGILNPGKAI
ncbi:FAD-binding oxidoreductase [Dactylosporangium sp. NPDC051541]|uniref:FAD-binding oxidoreductase n=1 Tax=Dactylosporangium sp. NPDC051541 TaxID=3363977 RepID=UPI003799ABD6